MEVTLVVGGFERERRTTRPGSGRVVVRGLRSAGLAVRLVQPAARAELLQLHAVGVVAPVLLGDVVALLALGAGERDLRANVAGLAGHGESFGRSFALVCSGGGIRTR